ncbi:MAG: hypothetical protein RLY31_890 [Bacteroidota bacterium]
MNILHIIPTYKPAYLYGGPVFSVSLLCEQLARSGQQVTVLATTANGNEELPVPPGVPQDVDGVTVYYHKRLTRGHSHLSPGLMGQLWRDAGKYDIIHIHSWWNIPVIACTLICWVKGIRPILSPRGMMSDFSFVKRNSAAKRLFHDVLGGFLLRRTAFHLTSVAEEKETAGLAEDHFVLPNLIQLQEDLAPGLSAAEPEQRAGNPFHLVFLSRIHPKKNLESLLEALSTVDFDFRLSIAGTGEPAYLEQLQGMAREKGMDDHISWTGAVEGEEKFRLYQSADLFVLPSYNENFANVVIEALSSGTPVMVSKEVGLSDYVSSHALGWVCGVRPEEIAATLSDAFRDERRLAQIRTYAKDVVKRQYSPRVLVQQYLGAYDQRRTKRK